MSTTSVGFAHSLRSPTHVRSVAAENRAAAVSVAARQQSVYGSSGYPVKGSKRNARPVTYHRVDADRRSLDRVIHYVSDLASVSSLSLGPGVRDEPLMPPSTRSAHCVLSRKLSDHSLHSSLSSSGGTGIGVVTTTPESHLRYDPALLTPKGDKRASPASAATPVTSHVPKSFGTGMGRASRAGVSSLRTGPAPALRVQLSPASATSAPRLFTPSSRAATRAAPLSDMGTGAARPGMNRRLQLDAPQVPLSARACAERDGNSSCGSSVCCHPAPARGATGARDAPFLLKADSSRSSSRGGAARGAPQLPSLEGLHLYVNQYPHPFGSSAAHTAAALLATRAALEDSETYASQRHLFAALSRLRQAVTCPAATAAAATTTTTTASTPAATTPLPSPSPSPSPSPVPSPTSSPPPSPAPGRPVAARKAGVVGAKRSTVR